MLLPASVGPAKNGQTPISSCQIARTQRELGRVNLAAARAKFAVLGYCQNPSSYWRQSVNLVSDVAQTQNMLSKANSTAAPGASTDGAGGYSAPDVFTGPEVVGMTDAGLIPPPAYPPLTTGQGPNAPVLPVPRSALPLPPACNAGSDFNVLPGGAAAWGNATTGRVPALIAGRFLGLPGAAWLAIAGLGVLGLATRGRR